jgi:hypothetical protein
MLERARYVYRLTLGGAVPLALNEDITTGTVRRGRRHLSAGKPIAGVPTTRPIAQNDAKPLQVLIRQLGQDADVNPVLDKTLGVFGHSE